MWINRIWLKEFVRCFDKVGNQMLYTKARYTRIYSEQRHERNFWYFGNFWYLVFLVILVRE